MKDSLEELLKLKKADLANKILELNQLCDKNNLELAANNKELIDIKYELDEANAALFSSQADVNRLSCAVDTLHTQIKSTRDELDGTKTTNNMYLTTNERLNKTISKYKDKIDLLSFFLGISIFIIIILIIVWLERIYC